MSLTNRLLATAPALLVAMGCAKAKEVPDGSGSQTDGGGIFDSSTDASCGATCDSDHDGVPDSMDHCPNTPAGAPVNKVGCADSQLTATLEPTFPPYGLTFSPSGDLGRSGGLTWTYDGIERGDLFHIYWIVCDDPATPCGLSLDGPIDVAAEHWQYSAPDSDLANGKLVFTNTTHILLADTTTPQLSGRLTVNILDAGNAAIPFADVAALQVTTRAGQYGAEIKGVAYKVVALAEVEDTVTSTWTPYMDYYDGAPTPDPGAGTGNATVSLDGEFYDK